MLEQSLYKLPELQETRAAQLQSLRESSQRVPAGHDSWVEMGIDVSFFAFQLTTNLNSILLANDLMMSK